MTQAATPVAPRPRAVIVPAAELAAWTDGAEALRRARDEAARLLATVQGERATERARGFEEGRAAGAAEAARLLADVQARTAAALDALDAALPELVLEVLQRVLGAFDPGDVLRRAVVHALGRLRVGEQAVLRASPDALDAVRRALAEADVPGLRAEPDPALPPGRCVLATQHGEVELGIEAQLRALRAGLRQGWGAASGAQPGVPEGTTP